MPVARGSSYGAVGETDASSRGGWKIARLSSPDQISHLANILGEEMTALDYPQTDALAVRLAIEEAVVNSLVHGHQNDPSKFVSIRYRMNQEQVLVEVEDQGPGFNPLEIPDPTAPENLDRACGRGILLMKSFMTWIRFNRPGNSVTLCKCRSEPVGTDI